jgi:hypothetical protein
MCGFVDIPRWLRRIGCGTSFFCSGDPNASFADFVYTVQPAIKRRRRHHLLQGRAEFQNFFRFEVHTEGTYT